MKKMGKGSKRRKEDNQKFRDAYDEIFRRKPVKVDIYSIPDCMHCDTVRNLTFLKGYTYVDHEMMDLTSKEWIAKIGFVPKTAPQVFVDDKYVGGCTDFITAMRDVENRKL